MAASGSNTAYQAAARHWESGIMTWRKVFPGRLDQVALARAWSEALLANTDHVDDAVLITAEFATNALRHTRSGDPGGWFGLEITRSDGIYIAVRDLGGSLVPQFPAPESEPHDMLREHGHGLRLVVSRALQVGVEGTVRDGHTLWALLAHTPAAMTGHAALTARPTQDFSTSLHDGAS